MENYERVVREALDTLESYITDLADVAETDAERKRVAGYLNRLARLVNSTREEMN